MRNFKVTPSTWLNDDEFVGVGTRTVKYWLDKDTRRIGLRDENVAVYGWTKDGKKFFIYQIDDGHITKLGTTTRDNLLDFRSLTV